MDPHGYAREADRSSPTPRTASCFINKEKTQLEQLEPKLSGILAGQSKKMVFLAAARNATATSSC